MITKNGSGADYRGLHADTKPTEAEENALFLEVDTLDFYYYTDGSWYKCGE